MCRLLATIPPPLTLFSKPTFAGETDARLEEMRDEVSGRLAEVHTSLADMDAESGPARAAALLAGGLSTCFSRLLKGI